DAAALRFGIGVPGQYFDAALHRALQRRAEAVRRHGGDDNGVIALVDEVIDELHLPGDARLGRAVVGHVHAKIFPRLFRAVAAAGKEADAHQFRDKGDAVRRLRRREAEGHRQDYQFCFHLTLRVCFVRRDRTHSRCRLNERPITTTTNSAPDSALDTWLGMPTICKPCCRYPTSSAASAVPVTEPEPP